MKIGRFSCGIRHCKTKDFKWFYRPISKDTKKKHFVFFWWFGHKWYMALGKRSNSNER